MAGIGADDDIDDLCSACPYDHLLRRRDVSVPVRERQDVTGYAEPSVGGRTPQHAGTPRSARGQRASSYCFVPWSPSASAARSPRLGDVASSSSEQEGASRGRSDQPGDSRRPRWVRPPHTRVAKCPPVAKNGRRRPPTLQRATPEGTGVERAHERRFPRRPGRRYAERQASCPDQRSNIDLATAWPGTDCGGDDDHVPLAAGSWNIVASRRRRARTDRPRHQWVVQSRPQPDLLWNGHGSHRDDICRPICHGVPCSHGAHRRHGDPGSDRRGAVPSAHPWTGLPCLCVAHRPLCPKSWSYLRDVGRAVRTIHCGRFWLAGVARDAAPIERSSGHAGRQEADGWRGNPRRSPDITASGNAIGNGCSSPLGERSHAASMRSSRRCW